MMKNDGTYAMVPQADVDRLTAEELAARAELEHKLLVIGTQDQMEAMSQRVKLGNAELDRRKKRRKDQRASRARNR